MIMGHRIHSRRSVCDALSRKGVKTDQFEKVILIPEDYDFGNSYWGMIDYLISKCGFLTWAFASNRMLRKAWRLT